MIRNAYVISYSSDIHSLINNCEHLFEDFNRFSKCGDVLYFKYETKKISFKFLLASSVLDQIENGNLDPRNVLVVQHGSDQISQEIIEAGATPFMLLMFESPLYAGHFYDNLDKIKRNFLFSKIFLPLSSESPRCQSTRFPSFSLRSLKFQSNSIWTERNFASLVAANKYVPLQSLSDTEDVTSFFWIVLNKFRNFFRGNPAPKTIDLRVLQLQDRRLELINFFSATGKLDLYGRGWEKFWRIPPRYWRHLRPIIKKDVRAIENKIDMLSRYKFNFCIENTRYPGYVTEKIFDAMVANTIPVYWGAPDIADFVPQETYIDISQFSSYGELSNYMNNLSAASANAMLKNAQEFLRSKGGGRYSYEGFLSSIFEKVKLFFDHIGEVNNLGNNRSFDAVEVKHEK